LSNARLMDTYLRLSADTSSDWREGKSEVRLFWLSEEEKSYC